MAVTITSPQSAVVARGSFTLSWTHDYPQARYEVLYRKKGDVNWSTFGQVSGTATSINVDCSVFPDFVEYQYRVIVYSEYADTTETTYSGSDASAAYAVVVVPASQVGKMKAKYGSGMIEVPLYSTVQSGSEKISMKASSTSQPSTNMLTDAQSQQFGSQIRAADGSGNRPIPHQATRGPHTIPTTTCLLITNTPHRSIPSTIVTWLHTTDMCHPTMHIQPRSILNIITTFRPTIIININRIIYMDM